MLEYFATKYIIKYLKIDALVKISPFIPLCPDQDLISV